ncbi:MAG: IS1595 family transposase [Campylobacterota bacterium]
MINKDFNSILDLINAFPDEEICIKHLEELRWNGYVVSPFDRTSIVYECSNSRYRCKNTSKYFNVKTGTLFDNTKVKLQKWFIAIWLINSHKKGISSLQLAKDINVTQKTAWFMLQRIRACFRIENDNDLDNTLEADETYVCCKNKNRHQDKKMPNSQARSTKDKTLSIGMVERNRKLNVRKVCDVTAKTLTVEIVRINTNTIEDFWSLLKKLIVGIYRFTSKKYLQRYVDDFVFRYNTRNRSESGRFNLLLANTEIRITYKGLIYG